MSPEGFAATMAQLTDMSKSTFDDMARLMRTPLQTWLEQRKMHPEAYNYIKVLAASQTAQAEPAMTPTGDFLGYMAIAGKIKMNLVSGSVATADEPGCIAIPQAFEKVVLAHEGQVLRNTRVKEVLIENGRAVGVRILAADNEYEEDRIIRADNVICTIPPKYIFNVLPKNAFPSEWVELLQQKFWGAGLLTGWYGMKRPQLPDAGIAEGSFVYMPGITNPGEGFIGVVDMVMCDFTAWGDGTSKRGPTGKREYLFSTALTDKEMRNPDRVNRVISLCEDWAKRTFPHWEENMEFCIWTPAPEAYGLWRPVGTDRPDVKSPWVKGLYFAGDQYGMRSVGRRRRWRLAVRRHVRRRHHRLALGRTASSPTIIAAFRSLRPEPKRGRRDEQEPRRYRHRRHRRGSDRPISGPGRHRVRARRGADGDPRRRDRQRRDRFRHPHRRLVQLAVQHRAGDLSSGRGTGPQERHRQLPGLFGRIEQHQRAAHCQRAGRNRSGRDTILFVHYDKLGTGVTSQGGIDLFSTAGISAEWEVPYGQHYSTVAALSTTRYKYETGTTDEQLSAICVSNRKWAELNPNAFFRKPLTIEEVMASKMLSTPLRAKQSNMLFDGGAAFLVTSAERARDITATPVYVLGEGGIVTHFALHQEPDLTRFGWAKAARQAFDEAGITPQDIDVAEIYDSYPIYQLIAFEEIGLCRRGEGGEMFLRGDTWPGRAAPHHDRWRHAV